MGKRKDTFPKQVYDREKRKLDARKEDKKSGSVWACLAWSAGLLPCRQSLEASWGDGSTHIGQADIHGL